MYYGTIKKYDIANGPGVRVSLFVSGCRHHCKGCFNAETWDFRYGQLYTEETEKEILAALEPGYIQGFTLLGGEPFEPENQVELVHLLQKVRETYPEKDIWCYSGYLWDRDLAAGGVVHTGDRRDAVLCGCAGGRRVRGSREGSDPAVSRKPEPEDSGA